MEYTLAFIFSKELEKVLLITKNRPDYQAGKLNGIGGKIEPGEDPLAGMMREVREETSLDIAAEHWQFAGNLVGKDWKVWIYTTIYPGEFGDALSLTDEPVVWYETDSLPPHCLENLFWLIPFCKGKLLDPRIKTILCTYQEES